LAQPFQLPGDIGRANQRANGCSADNVWLDPAFLSESMIPM
jgi:hypothetical protein